MTTDALTSVLAQQVLGWSAAPDRFLMGNRRWIPRWRFAPLTSLEDAFRLLDAAQPEEFALSGSGNGEFWVQVRLPGGCGEARDTSKPRAIAYAVARALGIELEEPK
ncbi:MAG: hypothetical protein ACLQBJ_01795 [Bryobacteraceae bacterium]